MATAIARSEAKAPEASAQAQIQARILAKEAAKVEAAAASSPSPSNKGEAKEAQAAAPPQKVGRPKASKASQWFWPLHAGPSRSAGRSAAEAAASGAASQTRRHRNDSRIDMSLDDIIKLQRSQADQSQAEQHRGRESDRNTYQTYNQNSGFFDGPQRMRKWFGRQNNYRRTFSNSSKPREFPSITRRSPPDRNNAASEENGNSESTARQYKNQNSRPERSGRQLTLRPGSRSSPSHEARAAKQKQQRDNKVNQKRGIPPRKVRPSERRSPNRSRYQVQIKPGSILTVSVANPQVGQNKLFKRTNGETSFPKDKWNCWLRTEKFQPKGISLRYNFRAVANQTKITLNERFSGLKSIRGDFAVTRPGSRTVTLP